MSTIERQDDGSTTEYFDVSVAGDHVERLMREVFTDHWAHVVVGPMIEGSAWEIQFAAEPKVTMLDGYLTVDPGSWHFHLCVNDHRAAATPELARIRRVARAQWSIIVRRRSSSSRVRGMMNESPTRSPLVGET